MFVRLFSVCVCFVYCLCLSVYCLSLFLYWQQKSSRLQQLHLPFLYCRLALASSEMTQRVFVCLFKNFICQSLTQSGWKHNRHKNTHSHNVFCTCLLICLKLGIGIFLICLFVLCQHNMRISPPFNLASSEMTQHGVEVKMVIMIRGWSFNLTGTMWCFHKEKHKKWWLGEKKLEKYLEEYFSCGKTKRSWLVGSLWVMQIISKYCIWATHTHTQPG